MKLDKRVNIDLCNDSDKIGENRDNKYRVIGNNCEPWISRECIYALEWSAGSSTLCLSYRLKKLVTVEGA